MTMDSRQIICIFVTIAIIFENANAGQLKDFGRFIGNESNTDAFTHALDNVVYERVVIKGPIEWCELNINGIYLLSNSDLQSLCAQDMEKAGFIGTSREALKLAFYKHNQTNAKGPKDFCNGIEPNDPKIADQITEHLVFTSNQQNHQPYAQQHEQFTFDLNMQLSVSTPPICPDKYSSFGRNQAETSTSDVDSDKSWSFDLNELPPEYGNDHLVLDSSQQHHQPHVQQNEQRTYDLNLQPSVSTPPIYPEEYSSFDQHQAETYTSYVDSKKFLGFDLNELPPEELEEDEQVEGNF